MQHTLHMPHVNRSFVVALAWLVAGAAIATGIFALINIEDEPAATSSSATTVQPASVSPGAQRYDSGPNEGAAQLSTAPQAVTVAATGTRYDGGPDEGTRGVVIQKSSSATPSGTRYDGGPDEGTRGVSGAGG